MMEASGYVPAIGVAAIAVAFVSNVPTDPLFNNTTGILSANPLGTAIVDLLIQAFGIAPYVPLIGFGVWGLRLIAKRRVLHSLWRASDRAPSALTNRTKDIRSRPWGSA